MANEVIKFEKTVLNGTGKAGILKPDADGYYRMNLGAFEMENASGIYYAFNDYLKRMFSPESLLAKRIAAGRLRGETEHPMPQPGQSQTAYFNRLRMIDGKYAICHFRDVTATADKDATGKKIIRIEGSVKPSGTQRHVLEDQIKSKEENVCFSVRTICGQYAKDGRWHRDVKELLTWDNVNDGGIITANKFDSAGLESATDLILTPELLLTVDQQAPVLAGLEGSELVTTTMIRDDLGWSKTQLIKPTSLDW